MQRQRSQINKAASKQVAYLKLIELRKFETHGWAMLSIFARPKKDQREIKETG